MRTLGALLAERRGTLVGREAELAALRDGPNVTVVHGVAGSGKSALLRAFRAELPGGVRAIDGAAIEPTPHGVLAAVGEPDF
ncbi:MAG TPA: ATP-binding protein, partial [Solirubrobacter sp.]|nr:ATP-binding protein [Solirubrobacter sp.]